MVLVEFLFPEKNTENQEFNSSENIVTTALFVVIVVFVLSGTSTKSLCNSEWIGNDMRTKIYLLWQRTKIMRIHHFSEHSMFP
jgi:hypothetical protein